MFVELSLKLYIPSCVEKSFKFMESIFQGNALIGGVFTHALPHSKLAAKFLSSTPRQKEITYSPTQHSFEICFPQQQKGVEETVIRFIHNQSENMKMT